MLRFACRIIWNTAESLNIDLGWAAPWVFGKMIGSKPIKVEDTGDD